MRRFTRTRCASVLIASAALTLLFISTDHVSKAQAPVHVTTKSQAQKPADLLPEDFAGWHRNSPQVSDQPADKGIGEVLQEYGLKQRVKGDYTRGADKLSVTATQFVDASGAFGAYTFYRGSNWPKEDIGTDGASYNNRILFWTGNTLVDATFDHVSAMSGAELRELAGQLPKPFGPAAIPPPFLHYLPQAALESQSTRYALGPEAYVRGGGVLPPSVAGFDRGAEVITAAYSTRDGEGALTMLSYPTPQLAAERQRAIEAFLKAGNPKATAISPANTGATGNTGNPASAAATAQGGWPQPLADSNPAILLVRRSGPIVALTSGTMPIADARKLLSQVNYTADITWNNANGYNSEVNKTAHLLIGILTLSGILGAAAIMLGLFLGGGRALYRRLRGKPASTLHDTEFVSLNLR
jgi:hypothetical protein